MKRFMVGSVSVLTFLMSVSPALAADKTDAFVCPVILTDEVLNSPLAQPIGEGHYTISGPDISVPVDATNADGLGTPPGPHSMPGDSNYTAIWAK